MSASPNRQLVAEIDAYLSPNHKVFASRTIEVYRRELLLMAAALGHSGDLDVETIQRFVEGTGAPIGPRTAAQRCAALRGFLSWNERFNGDVMAIQPPRAVGLPLPPLAAPEVERVWRAAGRCAPRERALVAVLLGCGLKTAQCEALVWSDVGVGQLRVGARRVPMPPGVAESLSVLRAESGEGLSAPVFANARGQPLSKTSICTAIRSVARRAKVAGVTPRALRTTCLAEHRRRGRSPDEIAHLMGLGSVIIARKALGELAGEIEDCGCRDGCLRCGMTGVLVRAPKGYVDRVAPHTAMSRLHGRAREMGLLARSPSAARGERLRLLSLQEGLDDCVEEARASLRIGGARQDPGRPEHDSAQVRLRAVASETRKLGQVFVTRGWMTEAWGERVESIGCAAELIARGMR